MTRRFIFSVSMIFGLVALPAFGQMNKFTPVTKETLLNPSPNDWLMYSRTYDNQRFSPLNQINKQNVGQLRMTWSRGMYPGIHENIPIVHDGVMYVVNPVAIVQALDATTGDLIWEYKRKMPDDLATYYGGGAGRDRSIALYEDMFFFAPSDGYIVALDAKTGVLRWETKVQDYKAKSFPTAGLRVVDGVVISGRDYQGAPRSNCCFITGLDAATGKQLWKFFTTAAPDEPGGDTWGGLETEKRIASPWGLPGGYDPVRKLVYWGVGNTQPHSRIARHGLGNVDSIPRESPSELYSNSTLALDPATGKLSWYYQHLPGDDWDSDWSQERMLIRTPLNPDPSSVKWISPKITRGQPRDVVITAGENGGLFVLGRDKGEFLWATPFPYDVPEFNISKIDVETGKVYMNWDLVLKKPGDKHLVCYQNTRNYWPNAYHPGKNALYIAFQDQCKEVTLDENGKDHDKNMPRPGSDGNAYFNLGKVDMATGKLQKLYSQKTGANGALLVTAGDLLFWGDMNRRFRAFDPDSGKILWESILGGIIQNSTITYSVNGKQYVAVLTGDGTSGVSPIAYTPEIKTPRAFNAIYVFALP